MANGVVNQETNEVFSVVIDGENLNISLADLAGLDIGEIEPYRGMEIAPEGVAEWRVARYEMGTMEVNDKTSPTGRAMRGFVSLTCEAIAYRSMRDTSLNPADYAGTEVRHMFFIGNIRKDIGKIVSFMQDTGYTPAPNSLKESLEQYVGHEFLAAVRHRKDANDPDRVYANFDLKTLRPLQAQPAQPAQPARSGLRLGK